MDDSILQPPFGWGKFPAMFVPTDSAVLAPFQPWAQEMKVQEMSEHVPQGGVPRCDSTNATGTLDVFGRGTKELSHVGIPGVIPGIYII